MQVSDRNRAVGGFLDQLHHLRVGHPLAGAIARHSLSADTDPCRKLGLSSLGDLHDPVIELHDRIYVTNLVTRQDPLSPLWYLAQSPIW